LKASTFESFDLIYLLKTKACFQAGNFFRQPFYASSSLFLPPLVTLSLSLSAINMLNLIVLISLVAALLLALALYVYVYWRLRTSRTPRQESLPPFSPQTWTKREALNNLSAPNEIYIETETTSTENDSPVETSSIYSPTLNDCDDDERQLGEGEEEEEEDDDLSSIFALAEMQVYLQKKTAPRPSIFIPIDDEDVYELEDDEQAKKPDLLDSTISSSTTGENQESLYATRKVSINYEELGFVDIKLT